MSTSSPREVPVIELSARAFTHTHALGLAGDPQYLPTQRSSSDDAPDHPQAVTRLRTYTRSDIAAEQQLMERCGKHLESDRAYVRLVAIGMTYGTIGGLIGKRPATVKDHVEAAARRLGVPAGRGPGFLVTVAFARRLLLPGMFDDRWPGPNRELTDRELTTVRWAAAGDTYDQIGKRLHLSPSAVNSTMTAIRDAYEAQNLAHLIARCHVARTIRPGDIPVPA